MADLVLSTKGISKSFAGVAALVDVDFDLEPGEVRALLGVNGAGKSVFIKILGGLLRKDAGQVFVAGQERDIGDPREATANGIASVQQHPELVNELTGFENIYLGREADGAEFVRFDRKTLCERAEDLARRVGLNVDVTQPLHRMSSIERELIAILQALSSESIRVLILDEPTSILTEAEKALLLAVIRNLKTRGVAVIYITHRLDEVFEIADSFTVFRGGRVVATAPLDRQAQSEEQIAELMLGSRVGEVYPPKATQPGDVVLAVEGLSYSLILESISFTARRGEVLGVFGLRGSGLDELSKVLFGALPTDGGRMVMSDAPVRLRGPKDALRHGIFLVPGDRWSEGLTPSRDVVFNTILANLGRVSLVGGLLRRALAQHEAARLAARVDLQPPDTSRAVSTFSGGNQQKVVIAKGLFADADLYIFLEPTAGVDIGARTKIYALIRELAGHSAVIVMSPDCDEVYGLSDRVLALYKGRLTLDTPIEQVSREELMLAGLLGEGRRHAA
jgi:ribose transport system ATP-binding protein